MLMHRRRRRRSRGGRLGSFNMGKVWTNVWAAVSGGGQDTLEKMTAPGTTAKVVEVKAAETTKKALKGKADSKTKLERELARGTECCPVIRVKCERREVEVVVKKTALERYVANPYASEKTYKKRKVVKEIPIKRKVKLCAVSAGKHQGELLPPKEAKQELKMLQALLKAENCAVRTAGDKLGGK